MPKADKEGKQAEAEGEAKEGADAKAEPKAVSCFKPEGGEVTPFGFNLGW